MFRRDFLGAFAGSVATAVAGLFGQRGDKASPSVGPAKNLPVPTPTMPVQSGYWRILRNNCGEPDQLCHIPNDCIRPVTGRGPDYPVFETDKCLTQIQCREIINQIAACELTGRPLILHNGLKLVRTKAYEIRFPGQDAEIVPESDIIHIA
jgi:hypothetical protein